MRIDDPAFLVQTCSEPENLSSLHERLEAAGARVVQRALAARGAAEPRALFHEAARALLRAMPPLLGPANAMLRHDRHLAALAGGLGLPGAVLDEILAELPWNDVLPPVVREGTFELTWQREPPWREHRLALELDAERLVGVVVLDLGSGPQGRAAHPDEGAHVLAFATDSMESPYEPIRFAVTAGVLRPEVFDFELAWSPVAGARASSGWDLVGKVRARGEQKEARARWSPSTPGVTPVWPRLPSWRELARGSGA